MKMSSHGYVMIACFSSLLYAILLISATNNFLLYCLFLGIGVGIALWDFLVWHHGEEINSALEEKEK